MSTNPISSMVAVDVQDQPSKDEERYPTLGNLIFYSLPDNTRITREQIEDLFTKHGIDRKHLLPEIVGSNAFKRATTKAGMEYKHPHPIGNGQFEIFMIRDVRSDDLVVARHVVREVRDSANKRLDYSTIGSLEYDKVGKTMKSNIDPIYNKIAKAVDEQFKELIIHYEGSHIRSMLRTALMTTLPATIRASGGLYFVSKEHNELINGLENFVKDLKPHGTGNFDPEFETIPVLDVEKQRKLIFDKYESQTSESVDGMLGEIAEILKDDKARVTKATLTKYANSLKSIKAGIGKYEGLLERDLEIANEKWNILQDQYMALMDKAGTSNVVN